MTLKPGIIFPAFFQPEVLSIFIKNYYDAFVTSHQYL